MKKYPKEFIILLSDWLRGSIRDKNHFEKYDNAFLSFLLSKENVLKEREFLLCLLTRLRFLPSEMACLLDVSPQVITNIRAKLLSSLYNIKGGAQIFDERIRKS